LGVRKTKPLFRLIAVIIGMLSICRVAAQPARQFNFMHYSTQNDLPSNQVNTIIQDSVGFIWIGTNDGLIRYDGTRYKSFRHIQGNPSSLPANQVVQLKYDLKKNLWVVLANGKAGIFNTNDFTFREAVVRIQKTQSTRSTFKKLIIDEYGNIMLLFVGQELVTYNEKINEFSSIHNFIHYNKDWHLNDIALQPGTRKYWLGFVNSGLAVYNAATREISFKDTNKENEKLVDVFGHVKNASEFLFDKNSRFWFSSADTSYSYIYCWDTRNNKPYLDNYNFIETFKSYYEVNGFFQQRDGTLWMRGFKAFGYFDEKKNKFQLIQTSSDLNGIDFRYISSIYEDREKILWIGTGNNGVFSVNPSMDFFSNIPHPDRKTGAKVADGTNISFMPDKDGTFLVGTWPDGLYRFNKNLEPVPLGIKGISENNSVIIYDGYPSADSNTIWMGSLVGFYAYDQKNKSVKHFDSPIFDKQAVREIAEDKFGNLWLGMRHGGLIKWDKQTGAEVFKAIPPQQINDIVVDRKGLIWVSGALTGLYVIDPSNGKTVMRFTSDAKDEFKLPEEASNAVLDYSDSIMVIGTPHHILLFNRDKKKITFLTSDETIYGNISSFEKDGNNNIWLSTTSSIYRANPTSRGIYRV
jgi:ligand-binding sensor domain-containing protein